MLAQRKKEIYDICVEFDIIIVEDDPYYFLQEGPYTLPSERSGNSKDMAFSLSDEEYIASLAPSFLSFDYQGRVIRLDTFSKTIAPGCRLGWLTCNPLFAERIERLAETSTAAPCGFAQVLIVLVIESQ
jgi:aromatic amino acid aminotransferase I